MAHITKESIIQAIGQAEAGLQREIAGVRNAEAALEQAKGQANGVGGRLVLLREQLAAIAEAEKQEAEAAKKNSTAQSDALDRHTSARRVEEFKKAVDSDPVVRAFAEDKIIEVPAS